MPKVKVGELAPDFTLQDQEGHFQSLSDYEGKKHVVLFFYPKDFSPGCTKQVCSFRDSYEDFTDQGAVVLGVSSDGVTSHKKFLDQHQLPFTLLSDPKGKIRALYGATKGFGLLPGRYTFLIDTNRIIRHIFTSEINMQKHIDEALRVLKEIST
jgi:peroxiredoxin Q/BCP